MTNSFSALASGPGWPARLDDLGVGVVGLLVGALDAADERLQRGEILVAAVDLLVLDDAVETLAALLELAGEIQVFARGEAEAVEVLLHHALGVLDALGNFDFLLAGQQRHLAHLLEVHPDGIVEDVELRVGLLLVGKFLLGAGGGLLVTVDLGRVDDVDLEVAQEHDDRLEFLGIVDALRNRLVEVVPRQVALVLGQLDEIAQAFLALGLAGPDGLDALGVLLVRIGDRLRGRGDGGRAFRLVAVLVAILLAVFRLSSGLFALSCGRFWRLRRGGRGLVERWIWRWLLEEDFGVMDRLDLGIGRWGNGERRGT